jgi:hypothetical protein
MAKNKTHFEVSHLGNLWKYVERVQHDTENKKSTLLHFLAEVDTEDCNTQATMYRSVLRIWNPFKISARWKSSKIIWPHVPQR